MSAQVEEVLRFWFGELSGPHDVDTSKSPLWWRGSAEDDAAIEARFGALVKRALAGELDAWADEPRGRLALVILLDQFTRSLGRGTAEAFAGDARAVALSLGALDAGTDRALRPIERQFLYMPLMHAEDPAVAERSVAAFSALSKEIAALPVEGHPDSLEHAVKHADIVRRFGRYPHRNALLGREPTAEEEAFLADGGPTFGQKKKKPASRFLAVCPAAAPPCSPVASHRGGAVSFCVHAWGDRRCGVGGAPGGCRVAMGHRRGRTGAPGRA